jgi:hypothetical protein
MEQRFLLDAGTIPDKKPRSYFGGLLFGMGIANYAQFIFLSGSWEGSSPIIKDAANGFVFLHNVKGHNVFFNAFDVRAFWSLLAFSLPLAFLGYVISPKVYRPASWNKNLLSKASKFGLIIGIVLAPAVALLIGSALIEWSLRIWPMTAI